MSSVNFLETEEYKRLRDMVREFVDTEITWEKSREIDKSDQYPCILELELESSKK